MREQYRFIRNKEKTEEIQNKLLGDHIYDKENYIKTPLGRVIMQHFILDDLATGESLHLINPYDVVNGGWAMVSEISFEAARNKFLEIVNDRGSYSMRFYYEAQLYQINSDGTCFLVRKPTPK